VNGFLEEVINYQLLQNYPFLGSWLVDWQAYEGIRELLYAVDWRSQAERCHLNKQALQFQK
jgi:hypothetical protein